MAQTWRTWWVISVSWYPVQMKIVKSFLWDVCVVDGLLGLDMWARALYMLETHIIFLYVSCSLCFKVAEKSSWSQDICQGYLPETSTSLNCAWLVFNYEGTRDAQIFVLFKPELQVDLLLSFQVMYPTDSYLQWTLNEELHQFIIMWPPRRSSTFPAELVPFGSKKDTWMPPNFIRGQNTRGTQGETPTL